MVDKYANDNKIDVTGCGYGYIFDRYCRVNAGNRELDLGELGEILEKRKVAEGLGSEIWMRGVSTERIFWEARDAKSEWARAGVHNVLLFDPILAAKFGSTCKASTVERPPGRPDGVETAAVDGPFAS